ncbi:hypothetical protein PIB30_109761, partial [Stylosanthes scabra]|nr:hypothetical protein [Stylosanthes scabra]
SFNPRGIDTHFTVVLLDTIRYTCRDLGFYKTSHQLLLSWSLRYGVARARNLGRAAAPPKESFLIKKGGRGRTMQSVRPRGQG